MFLREIDAVLPEIVEIRRQLHRIPEIAGKEFRTSEMIRRYLAEIPELEVLPPFLETDVIAILRGGKGDGINVTLRADIDALPLAEHTGLPFASEIPGMMHGCGHDGHAAILLGVAKVLAAQKEDFAGTVRFVWQPGEESRAMGKFLVAAGALDDPAPALLSGLHIWPGVPAGEIRTRPGALMASSDHFQVDITGQGGHGSRPDLSRNPLLALCETVTALQVASINRKDPRRSGLVSICCIHGGDADNVIPESCWFAGTVRAFDEEVRRMLLDMIKEVSERVAATHRVSSKVTVADGYNVLINDRRETGFAVEALRRAGLTVDLYEDPHMSSEDFSFYADKGPCVYLNLGNGVDSGELHSSEFVINEDILGKGIAALTAVALARLNR